jgi:hypothetical protein
MSTKTLLTTGTLLLAISARPLFLMARELVVGLRVETRYSIQRIPTDRRGMVSDAIEAEIQGHWVRLTDDQPASEDRSARVVGRVRITIDGRDFSHTAPVTIRPGFTDDNRYWGYVHLTKVIDHLQGQPELIVAQNLGREEYRVLLLTADGRVREDTFNYSDRCSPPVRALQIRYVVPHPSGYCSDVMQGWPSLLYPILFPWTSGAIGLLCTAAGLRSVFRGRRKAREAGA